MSDSFSASGSGMSVSRSSKTTNLEQIWDDLKEGIQQIYLKQDMARPRYMQLYTYPFRHNLHFLGQPH